MKAVRPENADPIPLRIRPPRMGIIILRFAGLLLFTTLALALLWYR
jgi:hypothetical protein